jgi:taurine dioxygenase
MNFELIELSAAGGAEVVGLDLTTPPPDGVIRELKDAFQRYGLLRFRAQALSPRQLADLGGWFGTLQPHVQRAYQHPEVPEIVMMTNRKPDGSFDEVGARRGAIENTRDGWHSDLSYDPVPAKATLLHSTDIPWSGGNTCFSNAHLAYESLDDGFKSELDGLTAKFVYGGHQRNKSTNIAASALDAAGRRATHAVHPVICEHPESGLPAIYVNPLITTEVNGVSEEESEGILNRLFDALDDPAFRYEHEWQVADTLLWDNRGGLMHTGRLDYPRDETRRFFRTTVSGAPIKPYRAES